MALTKVRGKIFNLLDNGLGTNVIDFGVDVADFQSAIDSTSDGTVVIIHVPSGTYTGDMTTLNYGTRTVTFLEDGTVTYSTAAPTARRINLAYTSDRILQAKFVTTAASNSSGLLAVLDDTIPQSTELQIFTGLDLTITPQHVNNLLVLDYDLLVSTSANDLNVVFGVFKDANAAAVFSTAININKFTTYTHVKFSCKLTAGSTVAATYHLGYAPDQAAETAFINTVNGVRQFGGTASSNARITEYRP